MKVEADTKRVCVLLFDGGGVVSYYHIVPISLAGKIQNSNFPYAKI